MSIAATKSPEFAFHQSEPPNGGPPLERLVETFLTSECDFFLRTHGTVPIIDASTFQLSVTGLVRNECQFRLADLESFPQCEVTATLQCAGNRRSSASAVKPVPNEVEWGNDAISNAVWTGCCLADVLGVAGISEDAAHVEFVGGDTCEKDANRIPFAASVPKTRALEKDVLLVWEMNHQPLRPEHGAPLRLIVPGYIGARSVKWLKQINVLAFSSTNPFHAHAYRLFGPSTSAANADWNDAPELGELSVNSCICTMRDCGNGVLVCGYATAGGDRVIVRVDVGRGDPPIWTEATFEDPPVPGVWRRWRALLPRLMTGEPVCARAWDSAANTQPERPENVWNFKGYMNNAWHRIRYKVAGEGWPLKASQLDYEV
jgi:sulfite oxidase